MFAVLSQLYSILAFGKHFILLIIESYNLHYISGNIQNSFWYVGGILGYVCWYLGEYVGDLNNGSHKECQLGPAKVSA